MAASELIPAAPINGTIRPISGQRVILDADLAVLYAVTTKALNRAVSRNRARFHAGWMVWSANAIHSSRRCSMRSVS